MLIKEDVLNVIQNIINEPIKRDGGPSKEIRILKAIEEMEEYRDDVVTCDRCASYQDGVCSYHNGSVYPDDYCSFAVIKEQKDDIFKMIKLNIEMPKSWLDCPFMEEDVDDNTPRCYFEPKIDERCIGLFQGKCPIIRDENIE